MENTKTKFDQLYEYSNIYNDSNVTELEVHKKKAISNRVKHLFENTINTLKCQIDECNKKILNEESKLDGMSMEVILKNELLIDTFTNDIEKVRDRYEKMFDSILVS